MEVENKQEKTDETTAACASAPAAAKKKKSVKEVLLFFLVSAGTGLIGIGTFTLLSKLNPFVQDAGIAFDLWLFFSEMLSVVLTCTFSFFAQQALYFQFQERQGRAAALSALLRSHHSARGSHDSRADKERMAADIGKAAENGNKFCA